MTERIQAAIEASRQRDEKVREGFGVRSDESLRALANDLGLITNPSLRLAASVASELLRRRNAEPRFREALAYAVNVMKQSAGDDRSVWEEEFARIERLLAGETEPGGGEG